VIRDWSKPITDGGMRSRFVAISTLGKRGSLFRITNHQSRITSVPYAGSASNARLGDAAGTLRLLAYLAVSVTLIVLDHRGGWIRTARERADVLAEPLREVASWPARAIGGVVDTVGTVSRLGRQNRQLRRDLLLAQARMARISTVLADNARLRTLLDAAQRDGLDVQLAPILDVDLDPTRQRLVLGAGQGDGVRTGQSVIDATGLLGQVTRVGALQSDVLLLTDPDHAVPVAVARNGVRLVAYGTGRSDRLSLASIPLSSDLRVGDIVVTSGIGGRFAPGFPVGRIVALRPDESRAFLRGDVQPAAQIDRGREVLLLRSAPARAPVVISTPAPAGPVGVEGGLTTGAEATPAAAPGATPAATPAPTSRTGPGGLSKSVPATAPAGAAPAPAPRAAVGVPPPTPTPAAPAAQRTPASSPPAGGIR
jgi:rod shape-determining protein MreC